MARSTAIYNSNRYNRYIHGTEAPKLYPEENTGTSVRPVRRRVVKAQVVHPAIVISWLIASIVLIITCGLILTTQNKMNGYIDTISSLENKIDDLKSENNFKLAQINEAIDMESFQSESEALGMVKLTPDKIIDVEYSGSGYMKQYKQIQN